VLLFFIFFFFGILKDQTFGSYIRKFIDLDRIRENKLRSEKFRKLVAETHNAQTSFEIYSRNSGLTLSVSFFFLSVISGKPIALFVALLVVVYNL
jgi:hypothetical protein